MVAAGAFRACLQAAPVGELRRAVAHFGGIDRRMQVPDRPVHFVSSSLQVQTRLENEGANGGQFWPCKANIGTMRRQHYFSGKSMSGT